MCTGRRRPAQWCIPTRRDHYPSPATGREKVQRKEQTCSVLHSHSKRPLPFTRQSKGECAQEGADLLSGAYPLEETTTLHPPQEGKRCRGRSRPAQCCIPTRRDHCPSPGRVQENVHRKAQTCSVVHTHSKRP